MTAITFDTHAYIKKLQAAGFTEQQAEVHAETLSSVFKTNLSELATRQDLKELEQASKRDIKELELRIAADMAKIHGELATLRWGTAVIVGGIVALLLKSFFPH